MVRVCICSAGLEVQDAAAHQQASQHRQFQFLQQEEGSLCVQQHACNYPKMTVRHPQASPTSNFAWTELRTRMSQGSSKSDRNAEQHRLFTGSRHKYCGQSYWLGEANNGRYHHGNLHVSLAFMLLLWLVSYSTSYTLGDGNTIYRCDRSILDNPISSQSG